ncbi:MAG: hypothetical protein U0M06_10980 [Clostridia bacterium]|nr:hypothetical protein [Clostridia bacterium]
MLNTWYSAFGGYFWMVGVAILTYLAMIVVKKPLAKITKTFTSNNKERRFANAAFGMILSVLIGMGIGKVGNLLFGQHVFAMWFVGAGLLAHYTNLLIKKFKDADKAAFADAFVKAMRESDFDISEDDLEMLTQEIGVIVKVFADNNANSRKSKIHNVASGIAGSIEITEDEQKELEKAIAKLKSAGIDTATIEAAYAKAKADGKITRDEKANLEAVIRAIHQATNI